MGLGSRQVIGHSVLPGTDGDKAPAGAPCKEDWPLPIGACVCTGGGTPHRCGFLQEPVLTAGTTVATGPSLPSREAACTVGALGRDPSPHLTRPAHHRSGSLLTQDSIPAA